MSGPRCRRLIESNEQDRGVLEALTRRATAAGGLVRRARIVPLAADAMPLDRIAREVGVRRHVVRTCADRLRSGRPRTFPP